MFEYLIVEERVSPAMNLKLNDLAKEGWRVRDFGFDSGDHKYVALLERKKKGEE